MYALRLISFFLTVVMTVQLLSLPRISKKCVSDYWTGEQPNNSAEQSGKENFKEMLYKSCMADSKLLPSCSFINCNALIIQTSEQIPSNPSADVVSPPPDR